MARRALTAFVLATLQVLAEEWADPGLRIPASPFLVTELAVAPDIPALQARIKAEKPYEILSPRLMPEELAALEKKAEAGDPLAMDVVFYAHFLGFGTKVSFPKARLWLARSFQAGGPLGVLYQGRCLKGFYLGDSFSPNRKQREAGDRFVAMARDLFVPLAPEGGGMVQTIAAVCLEQSGDREGALKWYVEAVRRDSCLAMINMAMLITGTLSAGSPEERRTCVELATKAAQAGYVPSWVTMADFHRRTGWNGLSFNPPKALEWSRKAAERGNPFAMVGVAEITEKTIGLTKDPLGDAFKWYLKAAQEGCPEAMVAAGDRLVNGRGVTADPVEAAGWMRKAAERGHPKAEYLFGHSYLIGAGVEKDEHLAFLWFQRSAGHGFHEATHALIDCYRNGTGTPRDLERYMQSVKSEAANGCGKGVLELARCYQHGLSVEKDFEKAVESFCKAAEMGVLEAWYLLGQLYAEGIDGKGQDMKKAFECYCRGADEGDEVGLLEEGLCRLNGRGTEKDPVRAYAKLRRCADRFANAESAYWTGVILRDGAGTEPRPDEAVRYLTISAKKGHRDAEFALGRLAEEGYGMLKSAAEARVWYTKAAAHGHPEALEALRKLPGGAPAEKPLNPPGGF